MTRIFQDDPDAISKLEAKLILLEKEKSYWKNLKPEARTYHNETDNMKRCFMLPLCNQNIRSCRLKIQAITNMKNEGITLERKITYKNGRPCFYYAKKENPEPQTSVTKETLIK